jgi:secreted trypsin-like serine protease
MLHSPRVTINKLNIIQDKFKMKQVLLVLLFKLINAEELCGNSYNSNLTSQEHFPWIATLYSSVNKTSDGRDSFLCGSSIVSEKFSLTAGHCIQEKGSEYRRKFDQIYLIANLNDLKHQENSFKIFVAQIFLHPDWKAQSKNYDADIALLKFKSSLIFNANISPICLFNENKNVNKITNGKVISFTEPEPGEPGYDNYEHDPNHNYPRIFNLPIRSGCQTKSQDRFREIESNRTFCAGGLNSGQCLEIGNSGSSMAVKIDNKYYARGIVSASFIDIAGCDNHTFTLFTDIPKFHEWIQQTIF